MERPRVLSMPKKTPNNCDLTKDEVKDFETQIENEYEVSLSNYNKSIKEY